jgi:hypothetical protein
MLGGYVTEFFAGLGVSDASSIWGSDGVFFSSTRRLLLSTRRVLKYKRTTLRGGGRILVLLVLG